MCRQSSNNLLYQHVHHALRAHPPRLTNAHAHACMSRCSSADHSQGTMCVLHMHRQLLTARQDTQSCIAPTPVITRLLKLLHATTDSSSANPSAHQSMLTSTTCYATNHKKTWQQGAAKPPPGMSLNAALTQLLGRHHPVQNAPPHVPPPPALPTAAP
jgi:hypothetical protein